MSTEFIGLEIQLISPAEASARMKALQKQNV